MNKNAQFLQTGDVMNIGKIAKFFVAALFLCGTITLIDASFNPVHAVGGKGKIKR